MNELIKVTQLPIIEEHLKAMSEEVDRKVDLATSLVCTEDTVKEVKATRADLNKQFAELEEQRKAVKKAVLEPYEQFESIYKQFVGDKFKYADTTLKGKISEVENELKEVKEKEVREFFNEYSQSVNIDWLTFEDTGVKITLSTSLKKMKEQTKAFIDRVCDDIAIFETRADGVECMIEYKKTLNLKQAIFTVDERHKELERIKALEEQRKAEKEAEKARIEAVKKAATDDEPLKAPTSEEKKKEQLYFANFKVKGTLTQLRALKEFLENGGYEYEC